MQMKQLKIRPEIMEVGITRFINNEVQGKLKDHTCTKKSGTIDFKTNGKPEITYDYQAQTWLHNGKTHQGSIHAFLRWYEAQQ